MTNHTDEPAGRRRVAALPPAGFVVPGAGPRPLTRSAVDLTVPGGHVRAVTVVSDAPDPAAGRLPDDYVMGVAGATHTLLSLIPPTRVGRALDLGTGCGAVALALREVADFVVGSDVCGRALAAAKATWAANEMTNATLVHGSLADPYAAGSFDLVAANPPFVIGAPGQPHRHRDAPLPGDELVPHLVHECARLLAPGGQAVLLGAWLHTDEPWQERVAGWLPDGVDAWVAQREELDCADYVDVWLRDSGESDDDARAAQWRRNLTNLGATAVGFGWIVLVKPETPRDEPLHWCEDVRQAVRIPTGAEVRAEFDRRRALPDAAGLLGCTVDLAPGAELVPLHLPGLAARAEAAAPALIERRAGWRGAEPLDPAMTMLLAAPSSRTLAESAADCAEALGEDPDDVRVSWLLGVRALAERGFVALK